MDAGKGVVNPVYSSFGIVDGWPGWCWIELAAGISGFPDVVLRQRFECKINNGRITNTHAIVRSLNWWNELFCELNDIKFTFS